MKSVSLKEMYSKLMYLRQENVYRDGIEIPGQYRGHRQPFPDRQIKIAKFYDTMPVFDSLRSPWQLRILGSDGKDYNFIIKHGEDLRQDERVQQLLEVMNGKLQSDKNCWANKLNLVTYKVVPLTELCGLLEMIPDCVSMKNLIAEATRRETGKEFNNISDKAKNYYLHWIRTGNRALILFVGS